MASLIRFSAKRQASLSNKVTARSKVTVSTEAMPETIAGWEKHFKVARWVLQPAQSKTYRSSVAQTDREAALLRLQLAILFHFGPLRLWPFANNRSTTIISQPNCGLSLSMAFDVRCIFTFHFHAVSSDTEAALFHPAELFCYAVWPAFGVAIHFFSRAWHTLGFAPPPKGVVAGPTKFGPKPKKKLKLRRGRKISSANRIA